MKKTLLCLTCLLCLLLSAACSGRDGQADAAQGGGRSYSAGYQLLNYVESIQGACVLGDRLYYLSKTNDAFGSDTVYSCALSGAGHQEHPDFAANALEHYRAAHQAYGNYRTTPPTHIIPDGRGGLLVLQERQSLEREQDNLLCAIRLDAQGQVVESIGLPQVTGQYQARITPLADGGYLYFGGSALLIADQQGRLLHTVQPPVNHRLQAILTLPDGRAVAVTSGPEQLALHQIDPEKGRLKALGALPQPGEAAGTLAWYAGVEGCDLVCSTGMTLYGYRLGEEIACEPVTSWLNCGVEGGELLCLAARPEGGFVCLGPNGDYFDVRQGEAATAGKTLLTLACRGADDGITDLVLAFNRKSDTHRIRIIDYDAYALEGQASALDLMTAQILSGNVPDILCTEGMDVDAFVQQGLLEDLWPWIDGDGELSRDSLVLPYFEALSQNGKLFQLSPGFQVHTVAALPHVAGADKQGWSWEEFWTAYGRTPQVESLFDTYSDGPADFLERFLLPIYLPQLLEGGAFDADEMVRLLEFSALLEENEAFMEANRERLNELKSRGSILLQLERFVKTPGDYAGAILYSYLDAENTLIGYPGLAGNGSVFVPKSALAMTAACTDKAGAWQFLRTALLPEGQPRPTYEAAEEDGDYYFPSNKAVLERLITAYQTVRVSDYGSKIRHYRVIDGEKKEVLPWDDALAEEFRAWLSGITAVQQDRPQAEAIILDEASRFFAGRQTAQAAAGAIASRVNLYLTERGR